MAQPIATRSLSPTEREDLTHDRLEQINKVTESIRKSEQSVALYKKRLRLYQDLLELNFDNSSWETFANKYEADLSHIVVLEGTPENYIRRGDWLASRIRNFQQPKYLFSRQVYYPSPPEKLTALYPHNQYFSQAISDYMEALGRTSDPRIIETAYTNLSALYSRRPQALVLNPNFPKWQNVLTLRPVLEDLDASVKHSRKALEIGSKQPHADVLKGNLVATYMINAEAAVKLGAYQTALEFYEAGQNYFSHETSECAYYAAWASVYIKLGQPDKAIEKVNTVPETKDDRCAELLEIKKALLQRKTESK